MTRAEFEEIQDRVQPQQLDQTDAFRLLAECRRLQSALYDILRAANLGDAVWGEERKRKAYDRLDRIHTACHAALDGKDPYPSLWG